MREVVAIADRHAPTGRGTVGFAQVFPNSRNVIPGRVTFSVDLRDATREQHDEMDAALRGFTAGVARETGCALELREVSYYPPIRFHERCVGAVRSAAERLGYSHMPAVSGPGHDAIHVARVAPAGMIFVPCRGGVSHNELERAEPEHLEAGCNVLLHAAVATAGVA
jgi:N-carbamoyl-L-amino-acid hydrolase